MLHRRGRPGELEGQPGFGLHHAADMTDRGHDLFGVVLRKGGRLHRSIQLGQDLKLPGGGRPVEAHLALEAQRGDAGGQPARGGALVRIAGDVLAQARQLFGLAQDGLAGHDIGLDEVGGDQALGPFGEGGLDLVQRQQPPGRGGQRHGERAQDVDLAGRIGGTQAALSHQFAQHHTSERRGEDRVLPGLDPGPQPGRRTVDRRHQKGHTRIVTDQHLDLARRDHPHHGGQAAALVQRGPQDFRQVGPRAQLLAQDLFDRDHHHGARRALARRPIGQVHQPVETRPRPAGAGQRAGDDPAHDEGAIRRTRQLLGHIGQRPVGQVGEGSLAPGGHHPFHRLPDELLIVTDQLMRGLTRGLALGNDDLLDRVLQFDAGRLELFDQIRPVQKLEDGDAVAPEPVLQHPSDQLAGMRCVEVLRAQAVRALFVGVDEALLRRFRHALGQDGVAAELHRVRIQRLLGDPHRHGVLVLQDFLGSIDGVLALFGRQHQRPRRGRRLADIELVVDRSGHRVAFCGLGRRLGPKALSSRFANEIWRWGDCGRKVTVIAGER